MKAGTLAEEGVPETFNLGGRGLVATGQGQEVSVTQRAKESSRKKRAGGCQLSALGEPRQLGGHRSKLPVFCFSKVTQNLQTAVNQQLPRIL